LNPRPPEYGAALPSARPLRFSTCFCLPLIFPDEFRAFRVPEVVLLLCFTEVVNLKLLVVLKTSRYWSNEMLKIGLYVTWRHLPFISKPSLSRKLLT
jgi:hypothetical protein